MGWGGSTAHLTSCWSHCCCLLGDRGGGARWQWSWNGGANQVLLLVYFHHDNLPTPRPCPPGKQQRCDWPEFRWAWVFHHTISYWVKLIGLNTTYFWEGISRITHDNSTIYNIEKDDRKVAILWTPAWVNKSHSTQWGLFLNKNALNQVGKLAG